MIVGVGDVVEVLDAHGLPVARGRVINCKRVRGDVVLEIAGGGRRIEARRDEVRWADAMPPEVSV